MNIEQSVLDWRAAREKRLAADKVAQAAKDVETALRDAIIDAMQASGSEGCVVDSRVTSVTFTEVPIVEDRTLVEKFILDHRALDLLQFRVSSSALRERTEAGVEVPGCHWGRSFSLSDRKLK